MKGKSISEEIVDYIRTHYADTTNKELVERLGISKTSLDRVQKRYGLKKSRSHLHAMGVKAGKASNIARGGDSSACYTPEARAKRVESYKKAFHLEEIRYKWGLTPLTKIKIRKEPRPKRDQRNYLISKGYIIDEKNLIAYWTAETHRSKRLEQRKPGGHFKSYYSFRDYEIQGR